MAKPLSKTVVVAYGRSAVAKSGKKGALRNLCLLYTSRCV